MVENMKILENTYIKDIKKLNKKIETIKKEGKDNIQIISDFDKSLTQFIVDGQQFKSVIAQIRDGLYLGEEYTKKANAFYDYYHPIEIDPNISFQEKKEKMKEWWSKHIILQAEQGLSKKIVDEVNKNSKIKLRDFVKEVIYETNQNNIPFLILSSGIGDFIEQILKNKECLLNNIFIISNFYDYDENGLVKGYKENVIHLLNKNEYGVKETKYYEKVKNKKNILLFGDSLSDVNMSDGFDYKEIITVGFLNENKEKLLDIYLDNFDIVITNDGSFEQVYKLLKEIVGY